ncbi:hypothetical protein [Embleya sp. NPDC020630]|uniref:hypothetical protein n=1 Tax=Embleya sp. NPDC020630 TaxID=3363979 RepID=UPI0037983232
MITGYEDPGARVLLANFVSPLAADLGEEATQRRWSEQAPRKLWLMRPDDVLVTPVPVSDTSGTMPAGAWASPRRPSQC